LSILPLPGPPKATTRGASRYGCWDHVRDGATVCHIRSSGGHSSGHGGRVRERHGWHDSPCGVGSERLREKGDKWDSRYTCTLSCQYYVHIWIHIDLRGII
jgi:hypothetical protein